MLRFSSVDAPPFPAQHRRGRRYVSLALGVQYSSGPHRSAPRIHYFLARARQLSQVNTENTKHG